MSVPVFENHGDYGGPAAILSLFYVWDVEPNSCFFLGPGSSRRPQEEKQEQTENDLVYTNKETPNELAERDRQYDDSERDQDNPKHVAIRNASRGKITLRLARPLCQSGKIFIVQLAHGFIDFLVVEIR